MRSRCFFVVFFLVFFWFHLLTSSQFSVVESLVLVFLFLFSLDFIMAFIVAKPSFLHKELKWFNYVESSGGQVSRDL